MSGQILIVEDHPLYRAALVGALTSACPGIKLLEAGDVATMLAHLETEPKPDLLLLDLNLPGAFGFSALAHLRGAHPEVPVVVISATDDPATVHKALALGAHGFISKSCAAPELARGVLTALDGNVVVLPSLHGVPVQDPISQDVANRIAQLTPQQFRVLGMLCAGRINKQIAHELSVTEATVKAHMTAIMRKLGVGNRTQAVLLVGRLALDPNELKMPIEEAD